VGEGGGSWSTGHMMSSLGTLLHGFRPQNAMCHVSKRGEHLTGVIMRAVSVFNVGKPC